MNAPALRPRSVGEILDLGFQLYRSRWRQMAAATAVMVVPVLVLQAVVPLGALGLVDFVSNLFFLAASAAVVVIASEAYMGRDVAAMDAVRMAGRRFLSVWGAAIIQGLLVGIGLLLLIIPGLILAALTFAMQQAVMIEGRTAGESFTRSNSLAEGSLKHILLTGVLAWVIAMFAIVGVGLAIGRVVPDVRLGAIALTLALVAINPLAAVVGTVLYYDLRIRKEAFDVSVMTDRLGDGPVPPEPAASL